LSKKISTKTTNVIFLTTLLVIGAFTVSYSSFAQDESYEYEKYGQSDNYYYDDDDDKPKDRIFATKKTDCNNININIIGQTVNRNTDNSKNDLLTDSLVDDERNNNGYKENGKFVCVINNNNNIVIGEEPEQPGPEPQDCQGCFTQNLDQQEQTALLNELNQGIFPITSFDQLCALIASIVVNNDPQQLQQFSNGLASLFANAGLSQEQFDTVLGCINDVFNGSIPPPSSS
jgi:hypothetical protein